jgi:hypothetical protein
LRGVNEVTLVISEVFPRTLIQKGVEAFDNHDIVVLSKEKILLLFGILFPMVESRERFDALFLRFMEVINKFLGIIGKWSSSTSVSFFFVIPFVKLTSGVMIAILLNYC